MKALRRSGTSSTSAETTNSPSSSSSSSSSSWIHFRSVLFVVAASSPASCSSVTSDRVHLKSPWSRKKRKQALSPRQWKSFFTTDGKLRDGGIKFLKKVRSGGVDPNIRVEVWPFLLGVYGLSSSKRERDAVKTQNRKEYEKLRRQCERLTKGFDSSFNNEFLRSHDPETPSSEDAVSARQSLSDDDGTFSYNSDYENPSAALLQNTADSSKRITATSSAASSVIYTDSSDSDSSVTDLHDTSYSPPNPSMTPRPCNTEDFTTWQRIIRVDAIRANCEKRVSSSIPLSRAIRLAEGAGLREYDHLEAYQMVHAARLVSILEAYAVYDPETGYCQGMSDLLSPIITIVGDDDVAFWCFVGFMKKARHNFRLDEVGIRKQLGIVSRIIKCKDRDLYGHLVKLQAEDCFFVYRMVVVLFRRELSWEQTVGLWEVMWADQAAIRAGIGKWGAWSVIRQRAPPTEDLLLYAIAASVLQRKKLIIERYSSMDEIVRECNSMGGQLDVWKLLDDAHDLVVTLHHKIQTSSIPPLLE